MSRPRIAFHLLLAIAGLSMAIEAHAASCGEYGADVTIHGVLSRATFPEQPNFESIAAGDASASYFFVTPDAPLCVGASRDDPAEFTDRLQVVFAVGSVGYGPLRPSLAQAVVCRGNLMHQMSGHHHSPVLLSGARCEPAITATAGSLRAHLDSEGAEAVLGELRRRPAVFDATLDRIAGAGSAWLSIASQLLAGADGANAEGLEMALGRAIPNDPSAVLALARHDVALERLCSSPFIEPAPGIATAYERRALRALATVHDPSLLPLARACADRISRLPRDGGA